ncbi:MAG TPA: response regulator transcription factor [Pseudolabrys sp.]|jgi:two-component system nitrate/nitrite response regulator NarL|nr:response regulator transcription factor [Pseudolabrys sp.]
MSKSIATVVLEPHPLVREGISSIISDYSYRVVAKASQASDIAALPPGHDGEWLVLLGARTAQSVADDVMGIRRRIPDCKIVVLFDGMRQEDMEQLLKAEIDGCLPLLASRDVLIGVLEMVTHSNMRTMVLGSGSPNTVSEAIVGSEQHLTTIVPSGSEALANTGAPDETSSVAPGKNDAAPATNGEKHSHPSRAPYARNGPKLSDRERQILEGLIKGHPNKVIARTCQITESTVKVHLKSILRKIQVGNRTQAAVWAMENGYSPTEITDRLMQATADL